MPGMLSRFLPISTLERAIVDNVPEKALAANLMDISLEKDAANGTGVRGDAKIRDREKVTFSPLFCFNFLFFAIALVECVLQKGSKTYHQGVES